MLIDFHVHTFFSSDSGVALKELIRVVLDRGLSGIAVCDHNTIRGAEKLREIAPFLVVVGEEIKTSEGEIIGYFLKREIPPYLTPEETVEKIKEQGGLVCLPHPFDRFRKSRLPWKTIERIKNEIDLVEGYNSRSAFRGDNLKAEKWARENGKFIVAGSDAHTYYEVGKAYTELSSFSTAKGLKEALKKARIYGKRSNLLVHAYTIVRKGLRRINAVNY
jgi:hypothetical protein